MADLGSNLGPMSGSQDVIYQNFLQDPDHTSVDLFNNPDYKPPDPDNTTNPYPDIGSQLISAAQKAGKTIGIGVGGQQNIFKSQAYQWSSIPRELYGKGFEGIGQERGQPPSRTRALQSENPREVWAEWYNQMKNFSNLGSK